MDKTNTLEEAIIGAWLLKPATINEAITATNIQPEWFTNPILKTCAQFCIDSTEQNRPVDTTLLQNYLQKQGIQENKTKYLIKIQNNVSQSKNATQYCIQLKHKQADLTLTKATTLLTQTGDTTAKIEATSLLLEEAEKYVGEEKTYTTEQIIHQIYDDWENNNLKHYPTQHQSLDTLIEGLVDTRLYIIAARPGVGKTSYILDIASNIAATGKPVLFVSLEMEKRELIKRLISTKVEIQAQEIAETYKHGLDDPMFIKINQVTGELADYPLIIQDDPTTNFPNIRAAYHQITETCGVKPIIIIDYLQLIRLKGKTSRYDEVTDISRQLKLLSKKLDTPVVCLSQLNRELENRTGGKAKLSDLRDSGAIEQDADVVILMYRVEESLEDDIPRDCVRVDVAKNRHGGCGSIDYIFDGRHTRFREYRAKL